MTIEEILKLDTEDGHIDMPNGYTLFWKTDPVIGRVYSSNEVDGTGVQVWMPGLVDQSTLNFAMSLEASMSKIKEFQDRKRDGS